MRVLVLTHPRSGGFNFTLWLSNELRLTFYHEPFHPQHLTHSEVLTLDNIIVKDFIDNIKDNCSIGLDEFISTFDKVIVLTRENTYETAISFVFSYSKERNDEWVHSKYTIDDNWIEKYKKDIDWFEKQMYNEIESLQKIPNSLQVTYEGIYENTDDIEKTSKYVGLEYMMYSDMLSSKYKLRNGEIGMKEDDLNSAFKISTYANNFKTYMIREDDAIRMKVPPKIKSLI
jgi:hypothetical protein